jgi:hypothetical protein
MNERRLAVCIGFLVPLAMVACGRTTSSGVSKGLGPPVIGAKFASRVESVCQAALEQKQAQGQFPYPDFNPTQPDLSKLPGIAEFEATTVTIFKSWQQKMLALGQPPTGQTAWAGVLASLSSHVRIIVEQQAAALRGDARPSPGTTTRATPRKTRWCGPPTPRACRIAPLPRVPRAESAFGRSVRRRPLCT